MKKIILLLIYLFPFNVFSIDINSKLGVINVEYDNKLLSSRDVYLIEKI